MLPLAALEPSAARVHRPMQRWIALLCTTQLLELEGGEFVFVSLAESISSKHCWIYDISDHVHPLHQITVPPGQITVRRADGQNLADST